MDPRLCSPPHPPQAPCKHPEAGPQFSTNTRGGPRQGDSVYVTGHCERTSGHPPFKRPPCELPTWHASSRCFWMHPEKLSSATGELTTGKRGPGLAATPVPPRLAAFPLALHLARHGMTHGQVGGTVRWSPSSPHLPECGMARDLLLSTR